MDSQATAVVLLWTVIVNLVIFEEIQYNKLANSRDTALLLLALWGPFKFPNDVNFELRP